MKIFIAVIERPGLNAFLMTSTICIRKEEMQTKTLNTLYCYKRKRSNGLKLFGRVARQKKGKAAISRRVIDNSKNINGKER